MIKRIIMTALLLTATMTANADWDVLPQSTTDNGNRFQAAIANEGAITATAICMTGSNEFKFSLTTDDYSSTQPIGKRKWFMVLINGNRNDPYVTFANRGEFFTATEMNPRSTKGFLRKIRLGRSMTVLTFTDGAMFAARLESDSQVISLSGVTTATDQLGCDI